MKVHKIYFGLPRLDEEVLDFHFSNFLTNDVTVKNYFCFWPASKFVDVRESILPKSDDHSRYIKYLSNRFPTQKFYDLSSNIFSAEVQLDKYIKLFNFPISYPKENNFRPEKFKISLTACCSQTILRAFAVQLVFEKFKISDTDIFVVTRPDVALDSPLPVFKLNSYLDNHSVLVPSSGHHAGGMPDTMIISQANVIKILGQFPIFFLDVLRENQELKYEYILKSLFINKNIRVLSFNRLCLISRNGRFKHSGLDGIVPSDIIV